MGVVSGALKGRAHVAMTMRDGLTKKLHNSNAFSSAKKTPLGHQKRPQNRRHVAGRRRVPGSRASRRRCCGSRGWPPQQPEIVGTAVIDANSPASVSLRALSASPRSKYVRRDDVRRRAPSAVPSGTLRNARSSRRSRARRGRRSRRPTSTGLHCGAHGLVSRRVRVPARRWSFPCREIGRHRQVRLRKAPAKSHAQP